MASSFRRLGRQLGEGYYSMSFTPMRGKDFGKNDTYVFEDQTQWVADQINDEEEDIVFLTQVGDIVNVSNTTQWGNADTAMGILDDDVESLAYGALVGNHDFDYMYTHGNFANFGDYFGPSRYDDWETDGWDEYGYSDSPEIDGLNHFQVFTGGGQQYVNMSLEWEPRQESINWAQGVIDDHPNLPVIISMHEFIDVDTQTDDPFHSTTSPRDGASRNYHNGQDIFEEIVYPNPQVFMVLCGHVHDWERMTSTNVALQNVYEMLADYQNWNPDNQPENYGYLRILQFDPDNDKIHLTTYSPSLDKNLTDSDNEFYLTMDFAERFSFPPTARLYAPVDNDVQDQDHLTNSVKVDTPQWEFQIQLYPRSGAIHDATVDADEDDIVDEGVVTITRAGSAMTACTMSYDADSDRITLGRNDNELFDFGTYEITISPTGNKITDVDAREMPQTVFSVEVFSPTQQSPSMLVPKHATWRYLDDGSDQGAAWIQGQTDGWGKLDFDDDDWGWGAAQLGYGDSDEATVVSYGPNSQQKYITTYFRHEFDVPNPTAIQSLTLKLLRDDGAVVYLNRHEIARSNMPGEPINYLTLASQRIGEPEEETYYEPTLDSGYFEHLVTGVNVIAVELHQGAANSSDISLDLQLEVTYTIPTLFDAGSGILSVFGSTTVADEITLAASGGYVTIDTGDDPVTILPNVAASAVKGIRVWGYGAAFCS